MTYKENLAALDNLVLVQFTEDSIVDPKQSESFGWFSPDNTKMIPMQVAGIKNNSQQHQIICL